MGTLALMEVRVGPQVVTIHADDQFLVCRPDATVIPSSADGYFVADTRLVSNYRLTLSRTKPLLVNSSPVAPFSARFEFVNDDLEMVAGALPRGTLHLRVDRVVGDGLHEDYDLVSYADRPVELDLEIRVEGDYADLFEVKSGHVVRRGSLQSTWDRDAGALTTEYSNRDFHRGLRLEVARDDSPPQFANGTLSFRVELERGQHWHTCVLWVPLLGDDPPRQPLQRICHALRVGDTGLDDERRRWASQATAISTGDAGVNAVVDRAVKDLAAMRLHGHDGAASDVDDGEAAVVAAGIPWFVSLFGRDSIIVSLQALLASSRFAAGALRALAALQAAEYDDAHDAQPGKIEHEVRHGELAHFGLIPQTPYYGTADTTILYVLTAAELWRWTGDRSAIESLRPHVDRALAWVDRDGDIDGDGLQEYKTRAGDWGYYNQGWKDSGTAIVGPDGARSKLPIALCELQGYVVAAKRAWADVLEQAFEDAGAARRLRDDASRLVDAIEARFWWADEGTYYLGLDGDKKPIASVASNPGHLLWSGAVSAERAASVVDRLLADDMWSGWGVRTLSSRHRSYNPFSYQCGSVWPHDNGILAAGFARYGHAQEAWKIARALFDAAEHFQHARLPEVFAGLDRDPGCFPAQYLGANVPQAWASGAVIHVVSTLAGLRPDAAGHRLDVAPAVPPWLGDLCLRGVRVGDASVDLRLSGGSVEVLAQRGDLDVRGESG